ncbi:Protein VTS1 [Ceratocystis platani]|uniref:RNA-binding protein VTS1 n=1 Tax=Ceratocystis fimbriata f. sp. platani TaxID=88771 RepID=A0A0F8BPG8_CERFI|nr:Protein VTS1 [Ceratocystis platani]
MTGAAAPSPGNRIRPLSDFYGQSQGGSVPGQVNADGDSQDSASQQWIADIDQFETTLEEMAAATLDQDFKEELSAIEQWFRVLSEAERTAALYALLQQTTQVQIRFFIQVLQHMGKSHPMGSVLSPTAFEKDPMSNRLSDAMNKLSVEGSRNSIGRNASTTGKRQSGLDTSTINAMFPDAAAAIATEKAKFTQQTGNQPSSTLVNPVPAVDVIEASQNSPWNPTTSNDVTKTTLVQAPMDHSDMARGRSPRGRRGTSKPPEDPTDPTLLQDIPSWLRSLRLHKYTDNLKDMKWQDLIELDDKALEERGVNALGARRKMLKVFEQVKEAKKEGKLP